MYAPLIKSARRVREHTLGSDHSAVLLTDIVSDDPSDSIQYTHLLVVFERGRQDPIAFISSESTIHNSETADEFGFDDLELDEAEGVHFLCAFTAGGHLNFGGSKEWANLDHFEREALSKVEQLQLIPR